MRKLAAFLDTAIRVPGTKIRFGADSILGLIPGIGDVAGGILSIYLLIEASRLGIPRSVLVYMLGNIALDLAAGSVPVLGDVFDVVYKANRKNVDLVEQQLLRQHAVDTLRLDS